MSKFFRTGFILILTLYAETRAQASRGDDNAMAMWREAVGLYTMEADDYLETVTDSLKEVKFWREKILLEEFENRSATVESHLARSNQESLKEFDLFIKENGVESLDDSLLMKAAQLEFDKSGFQLSQGMKVYQKQTELSMKGQSAPSSTLPTPDYSKVIYFTGELMARFPLSPLADSASYLTGYCLFDEGKNAKAEKIYADLIEAHPNSEFAPEVRWRLAEVYFDSEKFPQALALYSTLAGGNTKFAAGARLKKGAILFSTGQLRESAVVLLTAYEQALKAADSTDPEIKTLTEESLDYLARIKGRGVAFNCDEQTDASITERLGDIFHRSDLREKERRTFLNFVSIHPLSKSAPRFMDRVIESYMADALTSKAQEIREKLLGALSESSTFRRVMRTDIAASVEAEDIVEKHLIASADYHAEQAKKNRSPRELKGAINLYDKFLADYKGSDFYTQANFDLAELYYSFGDYPHASQFYRRASENEDSGASREEAAYGYFLSQAKLNNFSLIDNTDAKVARDSEGKIAAPTEITPAEARFLEGAEFYVSATESGSRRQRVLYRVAEIYFSHAQFAKVKQTLDLLFSSGESSVVKVAAERLMAATYDLENNLAQALSASRGLTFVDDVGFVKNDLSEIPEVAKNLRDGQITEAAALLEAFALTKIDSEPAAEALFRAALFYRQSGDITSSNRVFDRFFKKFPRSKFAAQAEFVRILNEVSLLKFDEAVNAYALFSRRYPKSLFLPEVYLNAAFLEHAMGRYRDAAAIYEKFAQLNHDNEIWFEALSLYREAGDTAAALRIAQRFTDPKVGRDFYLRGLFETAALDPQRKQNCRILQAAESHYGGSLSAKSLHAVKGCAFLEAHGISADLAQLVEQIKESPRDKVADFREKLTALREAEKSVVATGDRVWQAKYYLEVADLMSSAAVEVSKFDLNQANLWLAEVASLNKKYLEMMKFAGGLETPGPARASFLQKILFLQQTSSEIPELKESAESEDLEVARQKLSRCAEKNDSRCAASLLSLGYRGPHALDFQKLLKHQATDNPSLAVALAQSLARDGKNKEALDFAKQAIAQNPQFASAYKIAAQVFERLNFFDLAKFSLGQGLRNTEGAFDLILQNGYLDLMTGDLKSFENLSKDFIDIEEVSDPLRVLLAYGLQAQGKEKEAQAFLESAASPSEAVEFARFALALLRHDRSTLERLFSFIDVRSRSSALPSSLLGYYFKSEKQDAKLSELYFERSKNLGQWLVAAPSGIRVPAGEEKK